MRHVAGSGGGWCVITVLLAAASLSGSVRGDNFGVDGLSFGLVTALADAAVLDPSVSGGDGGFAPSRSKGVDAEVRQSVPVRDRSVSFREGDLFRNSKLALPLLVADLEPRSFAAVRPMTGRAVGVQQTRAGDSTARPLEIPMSSVSAARGWR